MKRWAVLIVIVFFLLGVIIGIVIISPLFRIASKIGGTIGIFLGLVLSWFVPGLWKTLAEIRNERLKKAMDENRYVGLIGYLIYPTQLPMTLGLLWLLAFLIAIVIFPNTFESVKEPNQLFALLFLPTLFLTGLSGLVMLIKGESVTRGGIILRGISAYADGIGWTLIGWGGCVFIVLALIFHWR